MKFPHLQKHCTHFWWRGFKQRWKPSSCSDLGALILRDLDGSEKNKNRGKETERRTKRKRKTNKDWQKRWMIIQFKCLVPFKTKERLQPQNWERLELRYWDKHRLPYVTDVNRKFPTTETLIFIRSNAKTCSRIPEKIAKKTLRWLLTAIIWTIWMMSKTT